MKALLIAYGGGHINVVLPLRRELIARGYEVEILGLTAAALRLAQEDIPYRGYRDFLEAQDDNALALGEELIKDMTLHSAIPREETVAYMGICYQELIDVHGVDGAEKVYAEEGRQAFLPRRFMARVLDRVDPDLVITTNSPRSEKAAVLEAAERGTPCYCVCDFYDEAEIDDRLRLPNYADIIFTGFPGMKEKIVQAGRSPEEVVVASNPSFDHLLEFNQEAKREAYRAAKGWSQKKVILWIKSVMPSLQPSETLVEDKLFEAYGNDDDVQLIVRLHPNESRDLSEMTARGCYLSTSDDNLHETIAASDVVIMVNSTIGYEAFLMGKPVIQTALVDFKERVPFAELGIGKEVSDIDKLVEMINNQPRKVTYSGPLEKGTSSTKIIDCIERHYLKAYS